MVKWHISVYGDPYGGDETLERVCWQDFDSRVVAQMLVDHLETLDKYLDYDFEVKEGPAMTEEEKRRYGPRLTWAKEG